ncbi:MAG: hypothetical protein IKB43_01845 [Fibrobacter sp.]|nr:hypothetical protein [Fibrobacter sp.]MBR2468887.1 hypothetical protein [Fibrobacter sp.]
MSVFSLVLILVAIIAAVVLLFPVVFRLDFHLTESGFVADLFVFKKRLWNYTKEWKAKEEQESEPEPPTEERPAEETAPNPAPEASSSEPRASNPEPQTSRPAPESPCPEPEASQADPHFREDDESRASRPAPEASTSEPQPSTPEPEAKKSLTEREFWTLLLTPDIDERGLRYSKKILNSFLNVFQVRFRDCYVEGIRMDYKSMGYGAALNAMLKGYPFLEDWDLRMDWTRDHDLQSAGHIEATVNLCRTVWFLTVSSVYGGIFAFVFWRRRAAVLKTGELPELGYVRTKILNWLVEE